MNKVNCWNKTKKKKWFSISSFSYYFITGNAEEWYYIGGPVVAIVFLLTLIAYIKKRREAGKMSPREKNVFIWHIVAFFTSVFWSTKELL